MKITFDIDGVITSHPEVLLNLAAILRMSGHEVGLCTGRPKDGLFPSWEQYFDFAITADGEDDEMSMIGKLCTTDEEKMCEWKPKVLNKHNVDLHFDDWADGMTEFNGIAVRIGPPKT